MVKGIFGIRGREAKTALSMESNLHQNDFIMTSLALPRAKFKQSVTPFLLLAKNKLHCDNHGRNNSTISKKPQRFLIICTLRFRVI